MLKVSTLYLAVTLLLAPACSKNTPTPNSSSLDNTLMKNTTGLSITSPSLKEGQPMDPKFTCEGTDISPALSWTGVPSATQSLVLIMDDPDAPSGTFTHWLLYGMKSGRNSLPEGVETKEVIQDIGQQGKNDFGQIGYKGPCPPPGAPHHYRFSLYALSTVLSLEPGAERGAVEKALGGKILAQNVLTSTYQRSK